MGLKVARAVREKAFMKGVSGSLGPAFCQMGISLSSPLSCLSRSLLLWSQTRWLDRGLVLQSDDEGGSC